MTTAATSDGSARSAPPEGGDFGPARFCAIDLHVHTPASQDVQVETYGGTEPRQVVEAAIAAGLDAIAITDHNTVGWCNAMAEAAQGTALVVLPGVEISTAEGHLLAIWEEGTSTELMEDVLVELGIRRADHGKLDIATRIGFAEAAETVFESGGLAIAAHVERNKGLLKLQVAAHVNRTLLNPALAAVEVVDLAEIDSIRARLGRRRDLACIRSSDVTLPGESVHVLAGIGNRRTWIKASRPDLCGLRHALADPSLRVITEPPTDVLHTVIESVAVRGGFLDGQRFEFSPDLNCLLGGTGAGKSLLIELVRFALDQQTDATDFPQVRNEVDSRLKYALTSGATVEVVLRRGDSRCLVRRAYFEDGSTAPEFVGDTEKFSALSGRIPVTGFSQGEVIEYARTPVGRMALVDAALDLTDLDIREAETVSRLGDNGQLIGSLESKIGDIRKRLEALPDVDKRLSGLSELFDADVVKMQASWSSERTLFSTLVGVPELKAQLHADWLGKFCGDAAVEANHDLYQRVQALSTRLTEAVANANNQLAQVLGEVNRELANISQDWQKRYQQFDRELADAVGRIDAEQKGLTVLRTRLLELQTDQANLKALASKLQDDVEPSLIKAKSYREELVSELLGVRKERRKRREERIRALNKRMGGVVRIKMLAENDDSNYLTELTALARGSRLRAPVLQQLCAESSPVKLVRSFLAADAKSVSDATGIELRHVETLFEHIAERTMIEEFLTLQTIDLHDGLSVEFRKGSNDEYVQIERLAHGQKCTAILIIALADGDEPLIIDQPEDALHAPWIEEYLVEKLRDLRGGRQYIFATRSPGLVVSADAEMIITLTSDAERGAVEATGSLERHDLNRLALYHLEGGPQPFRRRTVKLRSSM